MFEKPPAHAGQSRLADHQEKLEEAGEVFREYFDGRGYALPVFDFGEGGRIDYSSNANRREMAAVLATLAIRLETGGWR